MNTATNEASSANSRTTAHAVGCSTETKVRLTVTGLDETGSLFREKANIVILDDASCAFLSNRKFETGGSLHLEFNDSQSNRSSTGGRVLACHPESDGSSYRVGVELEVPQKMRVKDNQASAPNQPAPLPASSDSDAKQPSSLPVRAANPAVPPRPQAIPAQQRPNPNSEATASDCSREAHRIPTTEERQAFQAEIKAVIASQVNAHSQQTMKAILPDIVKAVSTVVSSNVEQAVKDAVKRESTLSYQETAETLQRDLHASLTRSVANSIQQELERIRGSFQKTILEPAAEAGRGLVSQVQDVRELEKRLAAHVCSAGEVGELIASRVQSAEELELRMAARMEGAEKIETHLAGQVRGVEELEKRLAAHVCSAGEVGELIASHVQSAEELELRMAARMEGAEKIETHLAGQVRGVEELEKRLAAHVCSAGEVGELIASHVQTAEELELRMAARMEGAEKIETHLAGQVRGVEELEKRLAAHVCSAGEVGELIASRVQSAEEVELRAAAQLQRVEESLQSLAAGLQLLRSAIKQSEKVVEQQTHSLSAACEREIRMALLRIADGPGLLQASERELQKA